MTPVLVFWLLAFTSSQSDADPAGPLVGIWEYRQRAGEGYDPEGERLEIRRVDRSLTVLYFGLEREGDHGLYYTAQEIRNVVAESTASISFVVPAREIFRQRPQRLADRTRVERAGYVRDELTMRGSLKDNLLVFQCEPVHACPERTMVFQRTPWQSGNLPSR